MLCELVNLQCCYSTLLHQAWIATAFYLAMQAAIDVSIMIGPQPALVDITLGGHSNRLMDDCSAWTSISNIVTERCVVLQLAASYL